MCKNPMEDNFECVVYGDQYFHSMCVGEAMMKDYLERNGWLKSTTDKPTPKFIAEKPWGALGLKKQ